MNHSVVAPFMALVFLLCVGCITRHSEIHLKEKEGAIIRGSERLELSVQGLDRNASKDIEQVAIVPEAVVKSYKVENWRETSKTVRRTRFLSVAGVHQNYSPSMDLFGDYIAGGIMGVIGIPIGSIGLILGEPELFISGVSGVISFLPFVSYNLDNNEETIDRPVGKKRLQPISKRDTVDMESLNGKRIIWEVYDPKEVLKDSGKIKWPGEIRLPLLKWAIEAGDVPFYTLKIFSKDIDLSGTVKFRIGTGFRDCFPKKGGVLSIDDSPARSIPATLRPVSFGSEPRDVLDGVERWGNAVEFEIFDAMSACTGEEPLANLDILRQWTQKCARDVAVGSALDERQNTASIELGLKLKEMELEFSKADSSMKADYTESLEQAKEIKMRSDRMRERLVLLRSRLAKLQATIPSWIQYYDKTSPLVGESMAVEGLRKIIRAACQAWCDTSMRGRVN